MRSCKPLALLRRSTPILLAAFLMGCAGTTPTRPILAALDCDQFKAPLKARTPGAPRPTLEALIGAGGLGQALAFGDAQTGQLDKANDRADAILKVDELCAQQQKRVLESLQPKPFWKRIPWPGRPG